jgi:UDP-glucose 6-dehydrogenase
MQVCVSDAERVGLANAEPRARPISPVAIDIVPAKVDMLNARQSPIEDAELKHYLAAKSISQTPPLEIVIKSTVLMAYTAKPREQSCCQNCNFIPTFLREFKAFCSSRLKNTFRAVLHKISSRDMFVQH